MNCVATVSTCDLDVCGVAAVQSEDGATLAILPSCDLDNAARYIARSKEGVYVDEVYSGHGRQDQNEYVAAGG